MLAMDIIRVFAELTFIMSVLAANYVIYQMFRS